MNFKKWFELDKQSIDALSYAGTIGLHMVSGIIVGGLIGYYLDKWLDTKPWFSGIMLLFGIVAGFQNVYIDSKRLIEADKRATQKKDEERRQSVSLSIQSKATSGKKPAPKTSDTQNAEENTPRP